MEISEIHMKKIFAAHGLEITDDQYTQLKTLVHVFMDWNSKINLSAIRQEEDIWNKHILDSLLVLKHVSLAGSKIMDLGAGGGFPSLPLSILVPSSSFSPLDSVGKKMKAVQDMAETLGTRVKTINGRAETCGQQQMHREQYDIVLTRAFAPWNTLLELALPFVAVGGVLIAYQGPAITEEIKKYAHLPGKLGGEVTHIYKDTLNGAERIFVCVKKIKVTPNSYPRMVGEPKHNPLQ